MTEDIVKKSNYSDFTELLIRLSDYRTLIFDLDNTIYNESDFLFQAYHNISKRINAKFKANEEEVFNFLSNTFLSSGRQGIFNKLQVQLQIKEEAFIGICLEVLRSTVVSPLIEPYPYFSQFIRESKSNPFFIITNGTSRQQANKIKSINWGINCNMKVVYANRFLPKPAPDSFLHLQSKYNLKKPIYIGDSPEDCLFAKNCGIDFIQVSKQNIFNFCIRKN